MINVYHKPEEGQKPNRGFRLIISVQSNPYFCCVLVINLSLFP